MVNEYNYANGPGMFAVSQRVMDKLSDEDQAAIKRAFANPAFSSKAIMDEIFAFEDKMRALHESQGGKIVRLSDEQIADIRGKLPHWWEAMAAEYGEDGKAIFELNKGGMYASSVALKDDTIVTIFSIESHAGGMNCLESLRWRVPPKEVVSEKGFFEPPPVEIP